jgi:hypothetical protein
VGFGSTNVTPGTFVGGTGFSARNDAIAVNTTTHEVTLTVNPTTWTGRDNGNWQTGTTSFGAAFAGTIVVADPAPAALGSADKNGGRRVYLRPPAVHCVPSTGLAGPLFFTPARPARPGVIRRRPVHQV